MIPNQEAGHYVDRCTHELYKYRLSSADAYAAAAAGGGGGLLGLKHSHLARGFFFWGGDLLLACQRGR